MNYRSGNKTDRYSQPYSPLSPRHALQESIFWGLKSPRTCVLSMTSDPGKVVRNFVSYTTLVLVVRPGLVADWNGQPLVLPLAPWFLRSVLKAKVPSTGCLLAVEAGRARADCTGEALRDLLQANDLVWGRACGVAARGHRASWSLALGDIVCRGHQRGSARISGR